MWQRLFALVIKEFLALLRDKASRFVLIGPPVVQLVVFGYAATFDLNHIPFAVFNEDPGLASRQLLARFDGAPVFQRVATLSSDARIAPLIDRKDVLLVLHIDRQFSRDILAGRPGRVQVIIDGRNSNTAAIVLGYANTILLDFDAEWGSTHPWAHLPAQLVMRAWYNPDLLSRWFVIPGIIGLLTLVVTMLVTALSIAREREMGTYDQLLVTPLRPAEVLLGKAIPGFIIGSGEATFIALVAILWFGVPFTGSVVALVLGLGLFLLSAIGIGLMISALAATQQQGLLGAFLFLVPAILLSGFATPIANMPQFVQYLTYLNPMRYLMVILRGSFLQGDRAGDLLDQYWPLAAIGLATMVAAAWLARKRMY
jgi:ABC-2 type transport system permease protein